MAPQTPSNKVDRSTRLAADDLGGGGRRALLEIGFVALTAAANLLVTDFRWKPVVIGASLAFWAAFIVVNVRRDRRVLAEWGFRWSGLGAATRESAFVLVAGALVMAVAAWKRGTLALDPAMLPLHVIYPAWGIVQQFLIQGLVVRHLADRLRSRAMIVAAGAMLFGLAHAPDLRLMGACAAMGGALTPIWIRHRNLWPLGIAHGWLGVLFYHWILGRVPWREMLG